MYNEWPTRARQTHDAKISKENSKIENRLERYEPLYLQQGDRKHNLNNYADNIVECSESEGGYFK